MNTELDKQIEEYFNVLPDIIKEVVSSSVWESRVSEIAQKYSLTDEQRGILNDKILMVIVGIESGEKFMDTLVSDLGISHILGEQLMTDIDKRVFGLIRALIEKGKETKETSSSSTQPTPPVQPAQATQPAPKAIVPPPRYTAEPPQHHTAPPPANLPGVSVSNSIPPEKSVGNDTNKTPVEKPVSQYMRSQPQPTQRPQVVQPQVNVAPKTEVPAQPNTPIIRPPVQPQTPSIQKPPVEIPREAIQHPVSVPRLDLSATQKTETPSSKAPEVKSGTPEKKGYYDVDPYLEPID